MSDNPYAAPNAALGDGTTSGDQSLTFTDYDLEAVSKATTWMRLVSRLQLVFAIGIVVFVGVIVLLSRGKLLQITPGQIFVGVAAFYVVMLVLGSRWLNSSCQALYNGIMENQKADVAAGFSKLRIYFVLYGVLGLLGLARVALAFVGKA